MNVFMVLVARKHVCDQLSDDTCCLNNRPVVVVSYDTR